MLIVIIVAALTSLRCCMSYDVGNDDVSNYFSSYVPRDHRNPIIEGISSDDLLNNKNETNDLIIEGIKNQFLPQFSNLNLSQHLKNILLKDYYLPKPYTKGDVSNLYNLDLLGSGLTDLNIRKKSGLYPPRTNYNWLMRNNSWPILWHPQYPRSNLFSNLNSSGYNLCNNHMSHFNKEAQNSVIDQPSIDVRNNVDIETENNKILSNGLLESEVLNTNTKEFIRDIGNQLDTETSNLTNNAALNDENIDKKLKNLTRNIIQQLPSLSDIYVRQSENDLTKLFNSFNTSSLLNKYENSQRTFNLQ